MTGLIEETSTLTAKGQTTIPKAVRQALGVGSGDRIAFRIDEQGVSLRRADADDGDPVVGSFLAFLASDLERRPEAIDALSPTLVARIMALTEGMDVDLSAEIDGDVDL